TGSIAIFGDAAESVVHIAAVSFAVFSLHMSLRPANERYPYGYSKISFFAAGFEGALILFAAGVILWTAVDKMIFGIELEELGVGILLVSLAGMTNGLLGWLLVRTGR